MIVEAMTEDDVPAALAIDLVSFPGGEAEQREKHLREELARAWARVRVAREDVVVGYSVIWHVADEIHLIEVAVDPAQRKRGIGRTLVEEIVAYGRARAAAKVLLEVRASNVAAIALYERLGFERFNVRKSYYADGEDGVEMMLELL